MIEWLRIRNLAVVAEAEIELVPGLNVLTGETGAGKSLVLGALALLAGARASADAVRQGAREARVEGVMRTERLPELEAELAGRGIEIEEHELLVARSVNRSGRSRAQLGGQLVPVSLLAELIGGRVEISSQHESQALRRPERHGWLLDAYGGHLALRERVAFAHARLRGLRAERERLAAESAERARREDFLRFQVEEIDAARLQPGEIEALEAEHARLAHAERLRAEATAAALALAGDPTEAQGPDASDRAAEARRRIEAASELDPSLAPLAARARAVVEELRDLAAELERYADRIEADPARLAEVEARLGQIERLRRKYGASEDEILAHRERVAQELKTLVAGDRRASALEAEEREAERELAQAGRELSLARQQAARRLAAELARSLAALDMPRARIEVALDPAPAEEGFPCGPTGAERVELLFAATPGEAPLPLRRIASGGELSRVFLALKNVLRRAERGMILVFDEIDAGVGGRAADRVGRVLAELAQEHQVLCITHLPQIAARADRHLRVEKRSAGGRATATVVPLLEAEDRIEELARMAGGERVSEATRRHARALLEGARRARPRASGERGRAPSRRPVSSSGA